ncbi:MAG TPA: hypothetical protein VFV33_14250, partial [Gemmatimonadaceae bacterium]|nr:hypothetical protein [Gemmatimonadaceae bacterium]
MPIRSMCTPTSLAGAAIAARPFCRLRAGGLLARTIGPRLPLRTLRTVALALALASPSAAAFAQARGMVEWPTYGG